MDATSWKTVEQGAATQTLLAASPLLEGVTGGYFADSNVIERSETNPRGLAPHAADPDAAHRLWALSAQLLQP